MYIGHFLYPVVYQWTLGCFLTLVFENDNAAMNMGSLQDPDFGYFEYISRIGIAGSSGSSAFKEAWIQRREKL